MPTHRNEHMNETLNERTLNEHPLNKHTLKEHTPNENATLNVIESPEVFAFN